MEIKKMILTRMDEISNGMSEIVLPTLDVHMWDGVNNYFMTAPVKQLNPTDATAEKDGEYHYLPIDETYLRLAYLRCKGWKKEINQASPLEDPEYQKEHNPYTRSGNKNPRVWEGIFEIKGKPRHALRWRGEPEKLAIQKHIYQEKEIPEHAKEKLSWYVAGEIFLIMGEVEKYKMCIEKSQ